MKPSWDDAPKWAAYLAMDADQQWTWFECKPEWSDSMDHWFEMEGRSEVAEYPYDDHAINSLESRP